MDNIFMEVLDDDNEAVKMDISNFNIADDYTFVGYKDYTTGTVQKTLETVIDRKQERLDLDNAIDFALWVDNQLI